MGKVRIPTRELFYRYNTTIVFQGLKFEFENILLINTGFIINYINHKNINFEYFHRDIVI